MSETLPKIAAKSSFIVDLEAEKKYFWCSCGLSQKQPFCDGTHKGSGFKSVAFEVAENKTVKLCGCKHSKNGVFCDGSHSRL